MMRTNDAMTAYNNAKDAAEAAQAAMDVIAAVKAAVKAEDAQAEAETAMRAAEDARDKAVEAAKGLLMIDDTMKSVGDMTVNATAPNQVVSTVIDGKSTTADTGLQEDLNPEHTVIAVPGVPFEANEAPLDDVAYVQAVAARTFDIGKVVDSADDDARLAIVTQYAGSKTVKVFADISGDTVTGTAAGKVSVAADGSSSNVEDDANATTLRPVGTFYEAGDGTANALVATLEVADAAGAVQVYSYKTAGSDEDDPSDDVTSYVRCRAQTKSRAGTPSIPIRRSTSWPTLPMRPLTAPPKRSK